MLRNWTIKIHGRDPLVNGKPQRFIVRAKTHDDAIDEYIRLTGSRAYYISARRV